MTRDAAGPGPRLSVGVGRGFRGDLGSDRVGQILGQAAGGVNAAAFGPQLDERLVGLR